MIDPDLPSSISRLRSILVSFLLIVLTTYILNTYASRECNENDQVCNMVMVFDSHLIQAGRFRPAQFRPHDSGRTIQARHDSGRTRFRPVTIQADLDSGRKCTIQAGHDSGRTIQAGHDSGPSRFRPVWNDSGRARFRPSFII